MSLDDYKLAAARKALDLVEPRMKLGLGTGSTAKLFVELLAERVKSGLSVTCVPTSEATRLQAERLGIRLASLDDEPFLDLTVDGADEVDAGLRLIKGGGGALLREKIVAAASDRMIVIADHTKQVEKLGRFPLPIEVVPFGLKTTRHMIEILSEDAGCTGDIKLRTSGDRKPFTTDNGHFILDCHFGSIEDADLLADLLNTIPGVVEHGLFLDLADQAIIAGPAGVKVFKAEEFPEA